MAIGNTNTHGDSVSGNRSLKRLPTPALNMMVKSIREKFNIISEKYRGISKSIGGLKREISNTGTSIKDYNSILKNIEGLETEINSFKLRQK